VYENRWFSVNLADVELPDGRHLDHFLIRLRPVAVKTAGSASISLMSSCRTAGISTTS